MSERRAGAADELEFAPDADGTNLLLALGHKPELRRAIGFLSSFCLQFTVVAVAAGLLLTFGLGFSQVGPLLLVAWIVGGVLQILVALSVAVAVSAVPLAGGPYQIVRALGHHRLGWHVGFMLILGVIAVMAGEAVGLVPYFSDYLGISLSSHLGVVAGAAVVLLVCTLLNLAGVKIAALVNNGAVVAEGAAILILVVGLAIVYFTSDVPYRGLGFLGENAGAVPSGKSSFLPFLYAMLVPFFVVAGFYANGTAGEETQDAARTVPRALWTSAVISVVLGSVIIFFAVIAVTNVGDTLSSAAPLTLILQGRMNADVAKLFEVLAVLALTVNLMLLQLACARMVWAYARDRQIFADRQLRRLNHQQVPVTATIAVAVVAVAFCVWSSLLNVLIAAGAVLTALPIAALIAVVLRAQTRGTMLPGPFSLGRWSRVIMVVAVAWTIFLSGVLVYQTPKDVGGGIVGVIVLGFIVYRFVPRTTESLDPAARPARTPAVG